MPERQGEIEVSTPPFLSAPQDSDLLGSEEWEGWMKWDTVGGEDISPQSSDLSPPSLQFTSGSTGSQSPPSEFDTLAPIDFSPIYSIPESAKPIKAKDPVPSKKRKSSTMTNNTTTTTRQPRGQKISHNVIEKRYRSNLNDKIAKLRDSIPELRTATPTVKRRKPVGQTPNDNDDSDNDDGGLKFNKATVLTKATEYIQQLERQNQRLQQELSQFRTRGGSLEKLRNPPSIATGIAPSSTTIPTLLQPVKKAKISEGSSADTPSGMIQIPEELRRFREANATTEHYGHSFPSSLPLDETFALPSEPVKGMIPLADDFQRLRDEAASQAHYAPESSYYGSYVSPQDTLLEDVDADEPASRWPRSKAMSRMLVGSLVGLMFMESFSDESLQQDDGSSIGQRGLFSLPTELLTESRGFRAQIRKRIISFLNSPASGRAASILIISAVFLAISFAIFLYLAPKGSKNVREGPVVVVEPPTPSSSQSSPIERQSLAPQSSTYLPPPAHLLESSARVSSLRMALDRVWSEWLGLEWLRSHHLDEEAFRRGGQPTAKGKEWPDISKFVPQFLQGSS